MSTAPIVVVIEDDPHSAEALALVLRDWGAETIVADRPEPALRQLGERADRVVSIITDYHLADGLTGIEAAHAFSAVAPGARVLVLTGAFDGRAERRSAAAGHDILFKPAPADAIVAWLEHSRPAA